MITPISQQTAERVADLGRSVAVFLHGIAGIAAGEVKIVDAEGKPFTVGLDLTPGLPWDDLRRMGLTAPKLPILLDPQVVSAIRGRHPFASSTVALSLCAALGFTYELIKDCDSQRNPHSDPALDFLRHVRNAAFHGNSFDIWPKADTSTAKWRGKTVDRNTHNTRTLFFDVLAPGDALLLLSDVLAVVQGDTPSPVSLW